MLGVQRPLPSGKGLFAVPEKTRPINWRSSPACFRWRWLRYPRVPRFASLGGADEGVRPYMSLVMGQGWFVSGLACLEGGQALVDLVPVDDVPPGRQIFGAAVVVFQIVGMLPHIVGE